MSSMVQISPQTLFELPLPATKGKISCLQARERVYVIELSSPPDNRLTTELCQTLLLALDILEARYPPGVLITTSTLPKFFSNGLDLEHALSTPYFFSDSLYKLWKRYLTYPMPTIALINGHAFAGALMTAMMHDYRIMNPHKGFLCLNELEFGVPLRPPMSSIFRQKVAPSVYRNMVLEAKRFKALDALKDGLIDSVGGLEETLTFVAELKLIDKASKGVYGQLKQEMWRETVALLDNWSTEAAQVTTETMQRAAAKAEREANVKAWEAKAKL